MTKQIARWSAEWVDERPQDRCDGCIAATFDAQAPTPCVYHVGRQYRFFTDEARAVEWAKDYAEGRGIVVEVFDNKTDPNHVLFQFRRGGSE